MAHCEHCGKGFANKCSLKKHIDSIHRKIKRFECTYCGKRFTSDAAMKGHAATQHDAEEFARFQCNVCQKRFFGKSDYEKHARGHLSKCASAGSRRKEMMRRGRCYHSGCGVVFDSGDLVEKVKNHLVTVHRDLVYAKYECTECKSLWYDVGEYRFHMGKKHDFKVPFKVL